MTDVIYNLLNRLFWCNAFSATLVLPILPLISAYREWRFIEWYKDFECSKWVTDFRIKDMWWELIKTHYQDWGENLKYFKSYKEKKKVTNCLDYAKTSK